MSFRLKTMACAAFSGFLGLSVAQAAETPYYTNVSDIEVESAVKGETYDKGSTSYFDTDANKKSDCCCLCRNTNGPVSDAMPIRTSSDDPPATGGNHVKYILDGKPVYEEGCAPATEKDKGTAAAAPNEKIKTAISQLGTSSWKDAQTLLVQSGKESVPYLIDALSDMTPAYNLGGHTKADAGRSPRQRTVAEVSAELLTDIVTNHSSYKGEVPAANQEAWRAWWLKNADGVTFASN